MFYHRKKTEIFWSGCPPHSGPKSWCTVHNFNKSLKMNKSTVAAKKDATLNFANISSTEDHIFMKLET